MVFEGGQGVEEDEVLEGGHGVDDDEVLEGGQGEEEVVVMVVQVDEVEVGGGRIGLDGIAGMVRVMMVDDFDVELVLELSLHRVELVLELHGVDDDVDEQGFDDVDELHGSVKVLPAVVVT